METKGLFIVIDGPSASGKDTIIKQLIKDLNKLGMKVLSVEETKEKKYDRKKILEAKNKGNKEVTSIIINERKRLYQAKVIPQLTSGALVIANRGEPTTLAYQIINNDLAMQNIWDMHRQQQIPLPNLVVIVNCSTKEAFRRENLRKVSVEKNGPNLMSGKFTADKKQVHVNYEIVKKFLEDKGISVIYFRTDKISVTKESQEIVAFIKHNTKYIHE